MTTSDYINLSLFVLLAIGVSIDVTLYKRLRQNLAAAVQILAELVLIRASEIQDSPDVRTHNDTASLTSRVNDLLNKTR